MQNWREENDKNYVGLCVWHVHKYAGTADAGGGRKAGLDADISAISETEIKKHAGGIDVLLLGPQIRFQLKDFKAEFEPRGVAVDVIEMTDYGRMNGVAVLDKALSLIKNSVKEET